MGKNKIGGWTDWLGRKFFNRNNLISNKSKGGSMKFLLSVFAFLFVLSISSFAQEKSCCSSGDKVKKEVSIEKSINKDGKTVEVKETIMKDGKTVEVKKVVKEDNCCSGSKESVNKSSDEKCIDKKDVSMKSDCCKFDTKVENKTEK